MLEEWINHSLRLASQPESFYSGARKIHQDVHFSLDNFDGDLLMRDCGFTKSKMSMLVRNYVWQASIDAAIELWNERVEKNKYGSVGFSCYNHFKKGDVNNQTPRGSKMGPCIQAVTLTLVTTKPRHTVIDCFYRTTELFKKFPADLVFIRDVLLTQFDFTDAPIDRVNFHFANVTCHPMYFVTMIPHMDDPIKELDRIKKSDRFMFNWIVKWTARYLCKEHYRGIDKFAQALRVRMDAQARITLPMQKRLATYLRNNHPGHRNSYDDAEDGEE